MSKRDKVEHENDEEKTTPPPKTPDLWLEMAEKGDVEGLMAAFSDEMAQVRRGFFFNGDKRSPERYIELLGLAMEVLARKSPAALSLTVLQRVQISQIQLAERVQRFIEYRMLREKRDWGSPGGWMDPDIANEWLPRLSKLQTEIKDTARTIATVTRGHELAAERGRGRVAQELGTDPIVMPKPENSIGDSWIHGADSEIVDPIRQGAAA